MPLVTALLAWLVALGPAAATLPTATDSGASVGSASVSRPSPPSTSASASPAPCSDRAYTLIGGKWRNTLEWRFESASTPGGLGAAAVLVVLKRSFDNITGAHNDCGLADTVSATSAYLGTTTVAPGVTKRGRCGSKDGQNVVGFGQLPSGILAVTCVRANGSGSMTEADIRINSNANWALSVGTCFFQELL